MRMSEETHENIHLGVIGFSFCHDVERAVNGQLAKKIKPTHLLFGGEVMDTKNHDYIMDVCKKKQILIRLRFNKSLNKRQFILIGKKDD